MLTHTLGFPRIGADRELKKALEAFWKGTQSESQLLSTARELRLRHWDIQRRAGIDLIPVGDFSLYDQMLDTSVMLGAIPPRFGDFREAVDLKAYFRMARGDDAVKPLEMSKWFDTNYHYLVPELQPKQTYRLTTWHLPEQVKEAKAAGITPKPVLIGPLTYLKLAKPAVEGFDPLDALDAIVPVYEQALAALSGEVEWIQLDEPVLVLDLSSREQQAFQRAYERLIRAAGRAKILLATYFGPLRENAKTACLPGIGAVHIDLVRGAGQADAVMEHLGESQILSLGIVDGRNVWRVDADRAVGTIRRVTDRLGADRVMLGSSCSLLHVPVDLDREEMLDPEVRSWLAFAAQKCDELHMLAQAAQGRDTEEALAQNRRAWELRRSSPRVVDPKVRRRADAITPEMLRRQSPFTSRKAQQQAHLHLPLLPTTTIGSFPQTPEIRKTRGQFKGGEIDSTRYASAMEGFIREAVDRQHELGLDVLVHGEPERNDMVEYFGEQLNGFAFTRFGWVQSYGSRCVKPPIIYGDVSRPQPMTVRWAKYAQSLTDKPMKGMLTGPVTILEWSFVRDDQPESDTCRQIALAMRDEVLDLEAAGIRIIQVDEAAFREGLPLRRSDWETYLTWAVDSFRLTTCGVRDETQIHTHMCYSEFNDILDRIAAMDADVISIEASRSGMELLKAFKRFNYPNDIGPGIYDIHSPRVPGVEEMISLLERALEVLPAQRLWINPDCGLKTRGWPESLESLRHMMKAAQAVRRRHADVPASPK